MTNPYINYPSGTGWANTFSNPASSGYYNPPNPGIGSGVSGLRGIVSGYINPELEYLQQGRGPIQNALFEQTMNPGALYGAANTAAMGYANQLFRPGGEVASLISRARGDRINQGWAPSAARGSENAILRGATQNIGNMFAQQAGQLEQLRYGTLAGLYGQNQQGIRDLLTSLYTGTAGAEQLKLAQEG